MEILRCLFYNNGWLTWSWKFLVPAEGENVTKEFRRKWFERQHLFDTTYERLEKFTGKHLCQSLFFNEVAGLRPRDSSAGVCL